MPKKGLRNRGSLQTEIDLPLAQTVEKNEVAAFEGIGGGGFGGGATRGGERVPEAAAEEAGQEVAGRGRGGQRRFGPQCNRRRRWRRR